MSIESVTNQDYIDIINTLRAHLAKGTQPSAQEVRMAIAVAKNGADRAGDSETEVAALRATWDTQIAILQAGGAGDISAEVDTADAAIEADLAAVEAVATSGAAYWVNPGADQ
jgi:hypothetical protein